MAKVTPDQVNKWAVVLDQLRTGFPKVNAAEQGISRNLVSGALENSAGKLVAQLVRAGVIKTPIVRQLVAYHCGNGAHPWIDMKNKGIKSKAQNARCHENLWLDYVGNSVCTGIEPIPPLRGWPIVNEKNIDDVCEAMKILHDDQLASILAHLGEVIAHIKIAKPTGKTLSQKERNNYLKIYREILKRDQSKSALKSFVAPTALQLCEDDKDKAQTMTHTAYTVVKRWISEGKVDPKTLRWIAE